MYTPHPTVFIQPPDQGISVWRYMDLSKFIWMIQRNALFFCRSDSLGDQFEGHYTKVIADQEEEYIKTLQANTQFAAIPAAVHPVEIAREAFRLTTIELPNQLKQKYFVSCWHMNEEESPAMWKLYTSQNESMCIRSKYKTFASLLPEESLLGCVRYIDYRRESFDTKETWNYIVHKRKSFEHEREIRAVIYYDSETCRFELVGDRGLIVPINMAALIKEIIVSPTSKSPLLDVVVGLAEKYGLNAPVLRSRVNDEPAW
jgi:hypothetical protein